MATNVPFTPQAGKTVNLVPTAATSNVLVSSLGVSQVRLVNTSSVVVYVALGASTVTASATTDMPLNPGVGASDYEILTVSINSPVYLAVATSVSVAATGAIFATPGEGF